MPAIPMKSRMHCGCSTTDFGDDKDRVMRKSEGGYTYFVPMSPITTTNGNAAMSV
ncbi:MAG: hypothetical protein CM15mP103_01080 [Gammaproteobacteria bacterium]|nr:MAG: hypothetical protein CM15mP103_01080 [Gammaproteobacteria bacterium]